MNGPPYAAIFDMFRYRDASADAEARARVKSVPELSSAFEALGFRSVGFYEMGGGPDRPGHVFEVWRSPDSRAFLTVEYDLSRRPRAELRTLLHDGTIIETSSRFSGRARLFCRSRLHHPESGYLLETSGATPEGLWRRHAERVEATARERSTPVPSHDSIRMQLALAVRGLLVSFSRRMKGKGLEWTVLVPATIAIVLAVVLTGSPLHWLTAVAVAGVAFWYYGEVSSWLSARLLHIPTDSIATLLAAVDEGAALRTAQAEALTGT